ncbi:hypothetical protein VDGL01_01773 [Verticillium dahliae]
MISVAVKSPSMVMKNEGRRPGRASPARLAYAVCSASPEGFPLRSIGYHRLGDQRKQTLYRWMSFMS